jgi:ELWxxDGT repeat protein
MKKNSFAPVSNGGGESSDVSFENVNPLKASSSTQKDSTTTVDTKSPPQISLLDRLKSPQSLSIIFGLLIILALGVGLGVGVKLSPNGPSPSVTLPEPSTVPVPGVIFTLRVPGMPANALVADAGGVSTALLTAISNITSQPPSNINFVGLVTNQSFATNGSSVLTTYRESTITLGGSRRLSGNDCTTIRTSKLIGITYTTDVQILVNCSSTASTNCFNSTVASLSALWSNTTSSTVETVFQVVNQTITTCANTSFSIKNAVAPFPKPARAFVVIGVPPSPTSSPSSANGVPPSPSNTPSNSPTKSNTPSNSPTKSNTPSNSPTSSISRTPSTSPLPVPNITSLDVNPGSGSSSPSRFTIFNNLLFFAATSATLGEELWSTDGTAAGTSLVKDINIGIGSSFPTNLYVFNNKLYFVASDGGTTFGRELYSTDGTSGGTSIVKDIISGPGNGFSFGTWTDLIIFNNRLFFQANDVSTGNELFSTDGTSAGTSLVKDIMPGSSSSNPAYLTVFNNTLYFTANGGSGSGIEIWSTDGTAAGTSLFKDINIGSGDSSASSFIVFNNKLYFFADGGTTVGRELYSTDGTSGGTSIVKDINPGVGSGVSYFKMAIANNNLYFAANNGVAGQELWSTDGTLAGTSMVKDIKPGSGSSNPYYLDVFNNKLFFWADDGSVGVELWSSDGTLSGTSIIKDFWAGQSGGLPGYTSSSNMVVIDNKLIFPANNGNNAELWSTDGTSAGTSLVKDINPSGGSNPDFLIVFNNELFFSANTPSTGTDLFFMVPVSNSNSSNPSRTPSNSPTVSSSATPTISITATPTISETSSVSPTISQSSSVSPTISESSSVTPTISITPTPTISTSNSPTPTLSTSNTPSPSPSYQPWARTYSANGAGLSPTGFQLTKYFCDRALYFCIAVWPNSHAWCETWSQTTPGVRTNAFQPPLPTSELFASWLVVATTELSSNWDGLVFSVQDSTRGTTSPSSGRRTTGSTVYSSITSNNWQQFDVAMTSANDFNMALTDNNANIRYSNNSGASAFTIPIGGSGRQMRAIDMTPNGTVIVVGESNVDGRAYLSNNSAAVSFTLLTNSPIGPYKQIIMSDDGRVIIANIENSADPVYYSIDYGMTWSSVGLNHIVNWITCSADGSIVSIHSSRKLFSFYSSSASLIEESISFANHRTGAISADGQRKITIGNNVNNVQADLGVWIYQDATLLPPSTTPSASATPTNSPTPSNTPTPSNSVSTSNTPSPSPSYQPWRSVGGNTALNRFFCDPDIFQCLLLWPTTNSWFLSYSVTPPTVNTYSNQPPFSGNAIATKWASIPVTDYSANSLLFGINTNGSPESIRFTGGSTVYSSITSSSWQQFDVAMTSANTFNMALTDDNANIRYSNNSGSSAFTIPIGGSGRQMRAIDMSSSGAHIVVGESNVDGRAYLSTDSAVSFTLLTNSPIGPYKRILISNSGSVIIANIENATHPVYYSIDAGSTWSLIVGINTTVNWISSTPDGSMFLIQADYSYTFNSTTGVLVQEPLPVGNHVTGAISADGKRRIYHSNNIGSYMYYDPNVVPPSSTPTPTSSSSITPTISNTPSISITPSNTPSNTPTPSNSVSSSNSPSPSPSYQPWRPYQENLNIDRIFCDPGMFQCLFVWAAPNTNSWFLSYSVTPPMVNTYSNQPPFSGNAIRTKWASIPVTDYNANSLLFGIDTNGSPESTRYSGGSTVYSSITSSSWQQFDVAMTSANTFNMALTDNNANIRYSNNSGSSAFTIPIGGSGRQMRAIDMSSSGAHIVVGESNVDGRAYLSTDSAVSFTLLTNSPIGPYKRILISNSGSVIVANIENATHPVYYSIDAGSTWSLIVGINTTVNWISSTPDGSMFLIQADYSYTFNSTTGVLVQEPLPVGNHVTGAISADGKRRIYLNNNVGHYIYYDPNVVPPSSTPSPTSSSSNTPSISITPTNTPTTSNTPTNTPTPSNTPSNTAIPSNTPSNTPSLSVTASPSNSPLPGILTWSERSISRFWFAADFSSDGQKIVVGVYNDFIYTSSDGGATWFARDSMRTWVSVASSSDGSKLVALHTGGFIYTSIDSGVTWHQRGISTTWQAVASSSDGTYLVAVVYNGAIYTSSNSGESSLTSTFPFTICTLNTICFY